MPISWKGTLQQYVGRLHRLHDGKRFVQVYDFVDACVPMLARMYERRLRGYGVIGYVIEHETFQPIKRDPSVKGLIRKRRASRASFTVCGQDLRSIPASSNAL